MRALGWSLVVVTLATSAAMADNSKQAAVHLKQGAVYYKAEQYDAAIEEFKKSYALDKKPQTLFNIANAYFKRQDFKSAVDYFQQYLTADPEGRFAKEAMEFAAVARKSLGEQEQQQRTAAATARVRNAEAFAKTGAWTSAGDEYRAAFDVDGDATHLIAAGDAYRKQPGFAKARDSYRAYLDKAPMGERSDDARTRLAEVTRELDAKQATTPAPSTTASTSKPTTVATAEVASKPDEPEPEPPRPFRRGMAYWGLRVGGGMAQGTRNPLRHGTNEENDGLVAGVAAEVGVVVRYDFTPRVALRPQLDLVYRHVEFDSDMQNNALDMEAAGVAIACPGAIALTTGTTRVQLLAGPSIVVLPHTEAIIDSQIGTASYKFSVLAGLRTGLLFDLGSRFSLEVMFAINGSLTGDSIEIRQGTGPAMITSTGLITGGAAIGFAFPR